MSRYQREKGKRGERWWRDQVRAALADAGLREYADDVQRGANQARDPTHEPDVVGAPYLWIECKSGRSPRLLAALDQAREAWSAAGHEWSACMPIAACRYDGDSRTAPRGVVVMEAGDFLALWAEWLARGER